MSVHIDLMTKVTPALGDNAFGSMSMGLTSSETLRLKVLLRQDMDQQLTRIAAVGCSQEVRQSSALKWLKNRSILHKITQSVPSVPDGVVDYVSEEMLKMHWIHGVDQTGV